MVSLSDWNVAHIDFDDCFEVAMKRPNYPEAVPFRLTPQFINAMQFGSFKGIFLEVCWRTMTVLHKNKDALMAVFSSFLHDPLARWFKNEEIIWIGEAGSSNQGIIPLIRGSSEIDEKRTAEQSEEGKNALETIQTKLEGTENVDTQVNFLIDEATSIDNLCQMFSGWKAYW
jgi:FKBP12-rapamycin complex-associated protein